VRISAKDSSATKEWGRISSEGTVLEDQDTQVAEVLVECDALKANVLILPSEMALIEVGKRRLFSVGDRVKNSTDIREAIVVSDEEQGSDTIMIAYPTAHELVYTKNLTLIEAVK
jgi:hypothetical protein